MMAQSPEAQARKSRILFTIAACLTVCGFCLFYVLAWFEIDMPKLLNLQIGKDIFNNRLFSMSMMLGIGLLFVGIGIGETNIKIKSLVWYNIGTFFIFLVCIYITDYFFDELISRPKPILSFILTTLFLCIYSIFSRKRH